MNSQCILIRQYHPCLELMENCSKYIFVTVEKWKIYLTALKTYTSLRCSLILLNAVLDNVFYQTIGSSLSKLIPLVMLQTEAVQ